MLQAIPAALQLGVGAAKYFSGKKKEKDAKNAIANLNEPFYKIQNEYYQNANQAAQMAQGGLPQATKDFYTNNSQRGLSAGIQGVLGSGGNPNDIAKLLNVYDDSLSKVSAMDAQSHVDNIKYYRDVNKDLAGQKNIQWALNEKQPYERDLKQLNAAQAAGEATKWEGISDGLGAVNSYVTSQTNNLEKLVGMGGGDVAGAADAGGAAFGKVGDGGGIGGVMRGFSPQTEDVEESLSIFNPRPPANKPSFDPFGNQQSWDIFNRAVQWQKK